MAIAYLGLGSNLGDRKKNILWAIELLEENKIHTQRCSTIIETEPMGGPPQGKFFNAVIEATTTLTPFAIKDVIKSIEKFLGRTRTVVNGARPIDIDILL